ncbi:MAG TPA: enolase C-terminal domain-like protein [Acidimicrobiales bacterium]|nr:enolase C-terminal domain-like protein [Acidimicrobiales bacterium]
MKVRLWRHDTEMLDPVNAAGQRHDRRERLFFEVEFEGVRGYGEVDPQPHPLNGDPGVEDVLDELVGIVIPQLRQMTEREGAPPAWSRIGRMAGPRPASNTAVALVEMALLDRELRAAPRTIEELWPPIVDTPLQVTVSMIGDDPWRIPATAARVRVKTQPGAPSPLALERLSALDVPVLLDLNCSAGMDDEVIELVRVVGRVAEVSAVEQPYAPGNLIDHARLADRLEVALSIDEGVRSLGDVIQIARYRAAELVCVKPARVGGLANARTIIARAREVGLRPYLGGFFESPYARTVHRALARQGVWEPSDLGVAPTRTADPDDEVDRAPGAFGVRPSAALLEQSVAVTFFD